MSKKILLTVTLLAATTIALSDAFASTFPDVPDGHVHQTAVEQLVSAGVINGNPDGNFYPDRGVNRAEMLKMLYLADGQIPNPSNVKCFPDVEPGSWYEPYVCDAAAKNYIAGYGDGTFRPGTEVNRVESLKMVQTVLGFTVPNVTEFDKDVIKFVDVSTSAWYTSYLSYAYHLGILPLPNQSGSRFYPDQTLMRGEAASMIYNALNAEIEVEREQSEQEMEPEDDEVDDSDDNDGASDGGSSGGAGGQAMPEETRMFTTTFPFTEDGEFKTGRPHSYEFELTSSAVAYFDASLSGNKPSTFSCTLFKLEESGLSNRYYLGYEHDRHCEILATLLPGSYQLQLVPGESGIDYDLTSSIEQGDGNDGFSEAEGISVTSSRTQSLGGGNLQNWYRFSVAEQQTMQVELTNTENLNCIIYPMADVDLYGFSGPQCNEEYLYPTGTYFVAVTRRTDKDTSQRYLIRLRE